MVQPTDLSPHFSLQITDCDCQDIISLKAVFPLPWCIFSFALWKIKNILLKMHFVFQKPYSILNLRILFKKTDIAMSMCMYILDIFIFNIFPVNPKIYTERHSCVTYKKAKGFFQGVNISVTGQQFLSNGWSLELGVGRGMHRTPCVWKVYKMSLTMNHCYCSAFSIF